MSIICSHVANSRRSAPLDVACRRLKAEAVHRRGVSHSCSQPFCFQARRLLMAVTATEEVISAQSCHRSEVEGWAIIGRGVNLTVSCRFSQRSPKGIYPSSVALQLGSENFQAASQCRRCLAEAEFLEALGFWNTSVLGAAASERIRSCMRVGGDGQVFVKCSWCA